jgi:hypothetical protein
MRSTIHNLHSVAKAFFIGQSKFVASHPGDEDILLKRLYNLTTPLYIEIIAVLSDFDPKYVEEDLTFLVRKFAESLSSIEQAEIDLQRAFYYNAFDQFLKDVSNVIRNASLAWHKDRPGKQVLFVPMQNEPVLEFR